VVRGLLEISYSYRSIISGDITEAKYSISKIFVSEIDPSELYQDGKNDERDHCHYHVITQVVI
jgi:hypothetical protein